MNQTKPTYKQQGNVGLFDSDETMEKLNAMGNPLDKLSKAVDFEMFRDTLERGLYKEKFTKVGAKPYDYVLMICKEGTSTCKNDHDPFHQVLKHQHFRKWSWS